MSVLQGITWLLTLLQCSYGFDKVLLLDEDLDGKNCLTDVFEIDAPSYISCALKCGKDPLCLSAFFSDVTSTCFGCDDRYDEADVPDMPSLSGSIYVQEPEPVGLGAPCSGSVYCDSASGFQCDHAEGVCICKPGTSAYETDQSCVATCPSGYGATFQKYDFHVIWLADLIFLDFDTIQECMDYCVSMHIPAACKSFDVDKGLWFGKFRCYFQNLVEPVASSPHYEHYSRKCI